MGRKKQVNALSKCYSLKVSEEQFNSIQSLSKADKANLNNIMRELINRFTQIKVYQNNTETTAENKSLPENTQSEIKVYQNNTEEIKVYQNNTEEIKVYQNNIDIDSFVESIPEGDDIERKKQALKSLAKKRKKAKVIEKSPYEEVMEAKAEYESKHNINSLF